MIKMNAGSVRATIVAMRNVQLSERDAARLAINAAGKIYKKRVMANASAKGHSLSQLAKLDYPFAKRHGRVQAGKLGGAWVQKPYMVHERKGRFKKAILGYPSTAKGGGVAFTVEGRGRFAERIILGTRIMLPRDIIWRTGNQKNVQKEMKVAIIKVLGAKLRTQSAIRFT